MVPGVSLPSRPSDDLDLSSSQPRQSPSSRFAASAATHGSRQPADGHNQDIRPPEHGGTEQGHTSHCLQPMVSAFAAVPADAPHGLSSACSHRDDGLDVDVAGSAVSPDPHSCPAALEGSQTEAEPECRPDQRRQAQHCLQESAGSGTADPRLHDVQQGKSQAESQLLYGTSALDPHAMAPGSPQTPAQSSQGVQQAVSSSQDVRQATPSSLQPLSSHFSLAEASATPTGLSSPSLGRQTAPKGAQSGRASPERHRSDASACISSTAEAPPEIKALRSSRGSSVGSKLKAQLAASSPKSGPPLLQSQLRKVRAAASQQAEKQLLADQASQVC